MTINLPAHDTVGSLRLCVMTPGHPDMRKTVATAFHREVEIKLPEGVEECDVEVCAEWLDNASRPVGNTMVLVERVAQRMPIAPPIEPILAESASSDIVVKPTPDPVDTGLSWDDLDVDSQAAVIVESP